jgi:hypothetical protein
LIGWLYVLVSRLAEYKSMFYAASESSTAGLESREKSGYAILPTHDTASPKTDE